MSFISFTNIIEDIIKSFPRHMKWGSLEYLLMKINTTFNLVQAVRPHVDRSVSIQIMSSPLDNQGIEAPEDDQETSILQPSNFLP